MSYQTKVAYAKSDTLNKEVNIKAFIAFYKFYVTVNMRDKKELLICAKKGADYINRKGGGNFVSLITDMLHIAEERSGDEKGRKQIFLSLLDKLQTSNSAVLGGGKSIKEGYKLFVSDFLMLKLKGETYEIENIDFMDLSIEDYTFIFAWMRRLVKTGSAVKNSSSQGANKKDFRGQRNNGDFKGNRSNGSNNRKFNKNKEEEPFNNPFAALKGKL